MPKCNNAALYFQLYHRHISVMYSPLKYLPLYLYTTNLNCDLGELVNTET